MQYLYLRNDKIEVLFNNLLLYYFLFEYPLISGLYPLMAILADLLHDLDYSICTLHYFLAFVEVMQLI